MSDPLKIVMGETLVFGSAVKVGSHHYAQLFAKENHVFWLALPWNILHAVVKGKKEERIQHWRFGGPVEIQKDFYCLSPFTLFPYRNNPIVRSKVFSRLALDCCIPSIPGTLRKHGFDPVDILWITDPRMLHLTDIVAHKTLFYRCVDDFSSFSDIPPSVRELEHDLTRKADVVYATSSALVEKISKIRKDVIYLPNGVNYDFFINSDRSELLPEAFRKKTKPIAVYVGTIGEWFDCESLGQAAMALPKVDFVVVGPVRRDVTELKAIRNITFCGPAPYESVPSIMKHSDVGIIPFKINALTDAVNPIKLFEYFSCGLPVVTPRTKEAIKINSPAETFATPDEFTECIRKAIAGGKDRPEFRDFASRNSWASRFEIIKQTYASLARERD